MINAFMKKIEYILKHNRFAQQIYRCLFSMIFRFLGLFFRQDSNMVLMQSFSGKRFNDSPRVLFERMLQRPDCESLHFVWAFNEPDLYKLPRTTVVRMDSWSYWKAALKSKYWITNVNIERGLSFKKKGTVYVMTGHGSGPKTGGNAAPSRSDYDFSNVDLITADGEYIQEIFSRDFGARKEAIQLSGRPICDALFSYKELDNMRRKKIRNKICNELGIPKNKKIVLYAPTWRESDLLNNKSDFISHVNFKKWHQVLGDEYFILLRAHSITAEVNGIRFSNWVKDCTEYPDINDLYVVADFLISDYSSVFTDYSILEKPMLCYAYDYDEYCQKRGLYFDLRKHITTFSNEDAMLHYLLEMNTEFEVQKSKEYLHFIAGYGGNATNCCIEKMLELGRIAS